MMRSMAAMHDLDALQVAAQYAAGGLSPVDVTRALLERIEAWEPRLNAMYRIDREGALTAAKAAEARWRAKRPLSPLDGVPVTIKENIYTKGDPAPIGTKANEGAPPQPADAPPAARLREAGCVILGKTTMPDFGMLSSGLSSIHGITRNPWNTTRNTSGSSSGAGAAAAAGYAPLHLGTDIGGSVRLPATHGGFFALKPSGGRIPINPPFMGRVAGPMTRTVADAACLMNIVTGADYRDFTSLPAQQFDYVAAVNTVRLDDLRGLRIGLIETMGVGLAPHAEIAAAANDAARALAAAGAHVELLRSFLNADMAEGLNRFLEVRSYNDFMALSRERQDKVLPFIREWCTWRASEFTGRQVMDGYNRIMAMREAAVLACQPFDYVISPTSPILPYAATSCCPGDDPHNALPHIAFTVAYNMSEQPAASLNWTYSADALPIGVQIIGRRFDDVGVLRIARAMEMLRPTQRAWPEPPRV